jgi:hypothetical protein
MRVRCHPRVDPHPRHGWRGSGGDGGGREGQTGAGAHAGTCARAELRARRGAARQPGRRSSPASPTDTPHLGHSRPSCPYHAARAYVHGGARPRAPAPGERSGAAGAPPLALLSAACLGLAGKTVGGCGGGPGDTAGSRDAMAGPGPPVAPSLAAPRLVLLTARLLVLNPLSAARASAAGPLGRWGRAAIARPGCRSSRCADATYNND